MTMIDLVQLAKTAAIKIKNFQPKEHNNYFHFNLYNGQLNDTDLESLFMKLRYYQNKYNFQISRIKYIDSMNFTLCTIRFTK